MSLQLPGPLSTARLTRIFPEGAVLNVHVHERHRAGVCRRVRGLQKGDSNSGVTREGRTPGRAS